MKSRQYTVVTPCRNEEKNLPNLIQSMIAQTMRPVLWVIVDDCSTDKTSEIISVAKKKYGWIKGIHLSEHKEYMGTHFAHVCNKGFEFANEYCNEHGISYKYLASVDADNILEKGYFEKLIEKFKKDEKLGISSGSSIFADIEKILDELKSKDPNVTVMDDIFWQSEDCNPTQIPKIREDLPMGSARMWRKECFEETRGFLPVPMPDSVSNAMAKSKNWKTRRFVDIRVIERPVMGKIGSWKGYKENGGSYFFLGQPLYIAILKSLKYAFKRPHHIGMAYLYGYLTSFVRGQERVEDYEVRHYYKHAHPRELLNYYIKNIKKTKYVG